MLLSNSTCLSRTREWYKRCALKPCRCEQPMVRILQQKAGRLQYFHIWPHLIPKHSTIEQIWNGRRARYMRRKTPLLPYVRRAAPTRQAGAPLLTLAGWRCAQLADAAKGGRWGGGGGGIGRPSSCLLPLCSLGRRPCTLRRARAGAALPCLRFKAAGVGLPETAPGIGGFPCSGTAALACPHRSLDVLGRLPAPAVSPLSGTRRSMPAGRARLARAAAAPAPSLQLRIAD